MRAQSPKRRKQQVRRRALADALGVQPCQIATDHCTGKAECFHELVSAAQGGSRVDPRNIAPICVACNGRVETHPDRYRFGWKIRRADTTEGEQGLVPFPASPYAVIHLEGTL